MFSEVNKVKRKSNKAMLSLDRYLIKHSTNSYINCFVLDCTTSTKYNGSRKLSFSLVALKSNL